MKLGAGLLCTTFLLVVVSTIAFAADGVAHDAIVITNDYEFTAENGVCSGSGTLADPYVIEDWTIDAGYDDYGIKIHGTTKAFIIRNVEISGAGKSAIYLSYVKNGTIEDCQFVANWAGVTLNYSSLNQISDSTFSDNTDGIHFTFSSKNQILANTFGENDCAIWLDASDDNQLTGNYIADGYTGLYLNLDSENNTIVKNAFVNNVHHAHADDPNIWDDGSIGNYWGGFSAIDANGDGIWDAPYVISNEGGLDDYPLMTHPLVPTPPPATCGV
jgi:parallel beta-helix repeat protein